MKKLLDKIKKVADSNAKLCYIDLALDSLGSRESRNKLKSLIEGMELIQK